MTKGVFWFGFFVGVVRFWFVLGFFSRGDFNVCCMDFAAEGS